MKTGPIQRTVLLALAGALVAVLVSACTLTGAEAPPAATEPVIPNAALTPAGSPTFALPVSPTPAATIDVFGTATAISIQQTGGPISGTAVEGTPGLGATPFVIGTPIGGGGTPSLGVTPLATEGGTPSSPFLSTPTQSAFPTFGPGATATGGSGGGGQVAGTCPSTYTVQAGDNLFRIALKFGLTTAELASANGITNVEFIAVGQVLKIPGCGGAVSAAGTSTPSAATSGGLTPQGDDTVASNGDILHVVKQGENLFRIALRYGLSYQVVASYNGITNPDQLTVGQVIHIPTK